MLCHLCRSSRKLAELPSSTVSGGFVGSGVKGGVRRRAPIDIYIHINKLAEKLSILL